MSRSLGGPRAKRKQDGEGFEQMRGRQAFRDGKPLSACPHTGSIYDRGKAHAWATGWKRERAGK